MSAENTLGSKPESELSQVQDWRGALEALVSFTKASTVDGVPIQLALVHEAVSDIGEKL